MSKLKSLMFLSTVCVSASFAGAKMAATGIRDTTKFAAIDLSNTLAGKETGAVQKTADTAVAIFNKEGNLVEVIVTGHKAATVYDAFIQATDGAGEDVTDLALDFTKKGVAITGGAANYVVQASLGTLSNLGKGIPAGEYTLVPLADTSANVVNSMIDYVKSDAGLVVETSTSLISDSHNLIKGILKSYKKSGRAQVGKSVKGIAKTSVNAVPNALNTVTKLFGYEMIPWWK